MLVLTLATCCLTALPAEEDQDSGSGAGRNWPQWRGPLGTGVAPHANPPLEWGESKNIRWKTAIPGSGHSTPIVWGDRVFVTGALDAGARRTLMCFDRNNGKQLWQQAVSYKANEVTHKTNPYCAASPPAKGATARASYGSAGSVAYEIAGT